MRIELVTEGGFAALPGLQRPIVLDCAALPPAQVAEAERLAGELAAAPPAAAAATALRDARTYRLTVDGPEGPRVYTATDQAIAPAFAALLELVRTQGHR